MRACEIILIMLTPAGLRLEALALLQAHTGISADDFDILEPAELADCLHELGR